MIAVGFSGALSEIPTCEAFPMGLPQARRESQLGEFPSVRSGISLSQRGGLFAVDW